MVSTEHAQKGLANRKRGSPTEKRGENLFSDAKQKVVPKIHTQRQE